MRWFFLAVSIFCLALRPSVRADEPAKPDKNVAMGYIDNAIALQNAKLDLLPTLRQIPSSLNHSDARAIQCAVCLDAEGAMKCVREFSPDERAGHCRDVVLAALAYGDVDAALKFVDSIGLACDSDVPRLQVRTLRSLLEPCANDSPALAKILNHAISVTKAAEAASGKEPGGESAASGVIEDFVTYFLVTGAFDQARAAAESEVDAGKHEKLLKLIEAVQKQPQRPKPAKTLVPDAPGLAMQYVLDGLSGDGASAEQKQLHAQLEPLANRGTPPKMTKIIEGAAEPALRAKLYMMQAAAYLKRGERGAAADCFVIALENDALVAYGDDGDVAKLAVQWLPMFNKAGDVQFLSKLYATSAEVSLGASNDSNKLELTLSWMNIGSAQAQNAVEFILYADAHGRDIDAANLIGWMSTELLQKVVGGKAREAMPALRMSAQPVATLLDHKTFLKKSLVYWTQQLGSPTADMSPEAKQRASDAATALVEIGPAAIPALVRYHKAYTALSSPSDVPRYFGLAAAALDRLGTDAIVPLVEVLQTESDGNSSDTIEALRLLRRPAVMPVVALIRSSDANVRFIACKALIGMAGNAADAIPALTAATNDADPRVADEAKTALAKINESIAKGEK